MNTLNFLPWRLAAISVSLVAVAVWMSAGPTSAQVNRLRPAAGGEVRALVIGVDAYLFEPALKGAVADARDIESTLRRSGVADVTALLDAASDRATVIRSLQELLARSRS